MDKTIQQQLLTIHIKDKKITQYEIIDFIINSTYNDNIKQYIYDNGRIILEDKQKLILINNIIDEYKERQIKNDKNYMTTHKTIHNKLN